MILWDEKKKTPRTCTSCRTWLRCASKPGWLLFLKPLLQTVIAPVSLHGCSFNLRTRKTTGLPEKGHQYEYLLSKADTQVRDDHRILQSSFPSGTSFSSSSKSPFCRILRRTQMRKKWAVVKTTAHHEKRCHRTDLQFCRFRAKNLYYHLYCQTLNVCRSKPPFFHLFEKWKNPWSLILQGFLMLPR